MTNYFEKGITTIGVGTYGQERGDYLQWYKPILSPLKLDFSWSPRTSVSQSCGNINISVYETSINTPITFSLIQTATTNHYIEAIQWDFGDGTPDYESYYDNHPSFTGMTHTFTIANFQNIVTMIATDNYNNQFIIPHAVYLI